MKGYHLFYKFKAEEIIMIEQYIKQFKGANIVDGKKFRERVYAEYAFKAHFKKPLGGDIKPVTIPGKCNKFGHIIADLVKNEDGGIELNVIKLRLPYNYD